MIDILVMVVQVFRQVVYLLVLLKVVLSYFMDPFHPFRQSIDRMIDPLLKPIQRLVPSFGRFDFSPLILIILVEVVTGLLLSLL